MRISEITRKTAETDITLILELDGEGKSKIDSGCAFLDHMLTLLSAHGRFNLELKCKGDCEVDYHHTAEDIGICLGEAFAKALGDKKGIERYGSAIIPMDEALLLSAIDFSGRPNLSYSLEIPSQKVGDFDTELVEEFWLGFVRKAGCSLHLRQLDGKNSHHIIEGAFKATARALKMAVAVDTARANEIPSTKGVL